MTIIPTTNQFEDSYVLNANNSGTHAALTTLGTNPEVHSLLLIMLNNYIFLTYQVGSNHKEVYYYGIVQLPAGRYTLAFLGGDITFGATDTFIHFLAAGMKLDLATDLPSQGMFK